MAGDLLRIREGVCKHRWLGPGTRPCRYRLPYLSGCLCERDEGHAGRCRCACGSTSTTRREEVSDGR